MRSVKVSSLLAPLAGLVDGDAQAATATLACLTSAAVAAAAPAGGAAADGSSSGATLLALHSALAGAFAARLGRPGFARTLQALAAHVPGLLLPPGDVVAAAAASGSYQAGALQLEEQLLHAATAPTQAASATGSAAGAAAATAADAWSAVADLYGQLGEVDLVTVTRDRLLVCPGSSRAVAAEVAGRPAVARALAVAMRAARQALVAVSRSVWPLIASPAAVAP